MICNLQQIIKYKDCFIDNNNVINSICDNFDNINKTGLIPSKRLRWWIRVTMVTFTT